MTVPGFHVPDPPRDLDTRTEIHDLVVRFYREVAFDDLLGRVFGEVAEVNWGEHIPKLIDYWCRVLLGQPGYDGFILGAHREVHDVEAFDAELFDRWYLLFVEAIDDGWVGPIAEQAKSHAARIAAVLARRLLGIDWVAPRQAGWLASYEYIAGEDDWLGPDRRPRDRSR